MEGVSNGGGQAAAPADEGAAGAMGNWRDRSLWRGVRLLLLGTGAPGHREGGMEGTMTIV